MGNKILSSIIKNKRVTLFIVGLLAILGMYSYTLMPKQENPQVTSPVAKISVFYPGATPEEMEETVTIMLEDEIASIEGIDYMESFSRNSASVVIVWLESGQDVDEAWDLLRRKMNDLQKELPEMVKKIDVDTDMDRTAGFILSVSGEGYSAERLNFYSDIIIKKLRKIEGISSLETQGEQESQIQVEINSQELNQHEASMEKIASLITANNVQIPSGNLTNNTISIPVETKGKFRSIEEIKNMVVAVSPEKGTLLHLKNIADISIQTEEGATRVLHNGEPSLLVTGYFVENKNIVMIGEQISQALEELTSSLPSDLVVTEVINQPKDIRSAVNQLMFNLLIAIGIVVFVVFLGMGLRNALVVAMAIPFSLLLSFSVMNFMGLQIHQISIAGFIISLGMLVDNAIVISDSIQSRIDEKQDRLEACIKGVTDVATPVFTATATTIAAYVPLLLLQGVAGEYIRSVPQIVIISLTASYLAAIFFTPVIAFLLFREGTQVVFGEKIQDFFVKLSALGLYYKKKTIYLAVALLIIAIGAGSFLPLVFFPKADKNIIHVDVQAEKSGSLEATELLIRDLEELLLEQDEIKSVTSSLGEGLPKFFITLPGVNEADNSAQMMAVVDLEKSDRFENNTQLVEYMQNLYDKEISGGSIKVKELEQAEPSDAPIIVRLTGDNRELLSDYSETVQGMLRQIEGTYNVEDDVEDKSYRYQVDVDTIFASQLGISGYDIQNEISLALNGRVISDIKTKAGQEYDVLIKSDIEKLEELQNFGIFSSLGKNKVLLKNISEVYPEAKSPIIKRYNRQNSSHVLSDVHLGYSAVTIVNQLQDQINMKEVPGGVNVSFAGEKENINKHFGGLGIAAIFAFLAIYIIMMIQFASTSQPFIILAAVPFSIIGASLGLLIFKQPLSFTALLGLVSLIGVVINNAIILMEYINIAAKETERIEDACKMAVKKRVRPILLTTGTTVLGLLPLIFSGTLFVPMAVALMSGLISSAFLTLVLLPVMYSLISTK